MTAARVPSATYRLQLNKGFTLEEATRVVGYLDRLGISDCYTSPLLRARSGSMHGYDVVDYDELNPEIGSPREFDSFVGELRGRGMGLVLDVVPNHMGANAENALWMDVLEYGQFSEFSRFFDIWWDPPQPYLKDRVFLPVLLDEYERVLRSGGLRVGFDRTGSGFYVRIHDHARVPLTPKSYASILRRAARRQGRDPGSWRALRELCGSFSRLPGPGSPQGRAGGARLRIRAAELRARLLSLCRADAEVRASIEAVVADINDTAEPHALDSLLRGQFYHLAYWKRSAKDINYRRFLTIDDLVAVRAEDMGVFMRSHRLILDWVGERKVTGLRVDHPDGLSDPTQYFRRLQREASARSGRAGRTRTGSGPDQRMLYVVAEKILAVGEPLDPRWMVDGTTGYDFTNQVNGIFVASGNSEKMHGIYSDFLGVPVPRFSEIAHEARREVMRGSMVADLSDLARRLEAATSGLPARYRGLDLSTRMAALEELLACFPVYRTYVTRTSRSVSELESLYVETAMEEARQRTGSRVDGRAWGLLTGLLLRRFPRTVAGDSFVTRFQQVTCSVMVKGVEDTAFYRYNRLVSLNEVGGEPGRFGFSMDDFHECNKTRASRWPHTMLCTSTHDTKRSEDVRARIDVLSEIPSEWGEAVSRWSKLNAGRRATAHLPSRNDEYLLYQTLVGVWPLEGDDAQEELTERVIAYMRKASKEAKQHTSWTDPDARYDRALESFVRGVLARTGDNAFLDDFLAFQRKVSHFGMLNSLSQLLLRLTSPGVPDTYQGSEVWDFSLVDPDNRRPVDFSKRTTMLDSLAGKVRKLEGRLGALATELLERKEDGMVKMFLLNRALLLRREHPEVFRHGTYVPLACAGPRKDNTCAFLREARGETLVVVAPRFFTQLSGPERLPVGGGAWQGSRIVMDKGAANRRRYLDAFTGEQHDVTVRGSERSLDLSEVLSHFSVALLRSVGTSG